MTYLGEHEAPSVISSIIPSFMEISTLMIGEIFAILPYSKVPGAGIGFLNQSTLPWINPFASIDNWSNDEEGSSGMKKEQWFKSSQGYSGVKRDSRISSSL